MYTLIIYIRQATSLTHPPTNDGSISSTLGTRIGGLTAHIIAHSHKKSRECASVPSQNLWENQEIENSVRFGDFSESHAFRTHLIEYQTVGDKGRRHFICPYTKKEPFCLAKGLPLQGKWGYFVRPTGHIRCRKVTLWG